MFELNPDQLFCQFTGKTGADITSAVDRVAVAIGYHQQAVRGSICCQPTA